ncbi:MAG: two-component sensor histidine kinase BarA, partial [Flavobacteriales bacterium]|nr:two-component sensor histidine kinase BarA [Flavobacteriales bacterium]
MHDAHEETERLEHHQTIRRGADRLVDVLQQVLDFSDMDAGRLTLVHRPFDLGPTIRNLHTLMRPAAEAKGLTLQVSIAAGLPTSVLGDERRLQQILRNLMDNAIKYTARGTIRVQVGPGDKDSPDTIRFSVHDTGPGIPQPKQAQLFEAFVQEDGSLTRRHEGAGLGLTIAQQLTRLMGG